MSLANDLRVLLSARWLRKARKPEPCSDYEPGRNKLPVDLPDEHQPN